MQDGSPSRKALDLDVLTEKWRTVNSLFPGVILQQINAWGASLQCRRILGGRQLLDYVRTIVTAIFVMTGED